MDVKLFVFDMGDVVIYEHDTWHNVFSTFGMDLKNVREIGPESRKAIWNMIVGTIEEKEFWDIVQKEMEKKVQWEGVLQSKHIGIPVPGTKELITRLKERGYSVVCGTNNILPFYLDIKEHGHYDIFHKTYSSFKIGIGKPDPEFWKYISREEGVPLEKMFFIDDNKENIDAAASLGVITHLFTKCNILEEFLTKEGLL